MSNQPERKGRVVRLDARGALVLLESASTGGATVAAPDLASAGPAEVLWCAVRGRMHHGDRKGQRTPIVVGDLVLVVDLGEGRGSIESALPRTRTFSRPDVRRERIEHVMAANVDRVALVACVADPEFQTPWIDRVLLVTEWSRLEAVVVVNKIDLVDELPPELDVYRAMGYEVFPVSATTGAGLPALHACLSGSATVFVGQSGVGKSSLLNSIQPGLGLEVGDVNRSTGRGTHTTTAAVWVPLVGGGAIVDTAGVRELGLFGIPKREIAWLFRDMASATDCRYPDCSHTHEPGCAVRAAVEAGTVAPWRYDTYVRILEGHDEPLP